LFFLLTAKLYAQYEDYGFPFVQNYPPKVYGYESQNFSVSQDNNGFIFVSNVSGILQYNGAKWKLIPAQGIPKLVSGDNGCVYAGLHEDFGILKRNQKNQFVFQSLVKNDGLKEKIGDVSSLISYKNEILFVGKSSNLYSYNGRSIKVIDSVSNTINLFKINNKLFVFKEPGGLYQYANGEMILWLSSKSLNNKIIEILLPYHDKFLLKFQSEKQFYILTNGGELLPFSNKIENYLEEHQYSCSLLSNDSVYVFGTTRGGIIGMNYNGDELFELSTDNLLINDNINALFLDKWNNLWLALNNGLARVELSSSFTYFNSINGVKGGVSDICRYNKNIYIATTQGVRYLDNTNFLRQTIHGNMFNILSGIQEDCNKMLPTPYGLLISTDHGLFFQDLNSKIHLFENSIVFEDFFPLDSLCKKTLVCSGSGLSLIQFEHNVPTVMPLELGFTDHTRTVAKDIDNTFWLGTDYNGIYHINYEPVNNKCSLIKHYKSVNISGSSGWIDVYSTSIGVLFSSQKGLFRLNKNTQVFEKDTFFIKQPNRWVFPLKEDSYQNIWFSSGSEGVYEKETAVAYLKKDFSYHILKDPFRIIKDYTIESIFADKNAVTWFGTFDGLIRFDAKKLSQDTNKLVLFISGITAGKDTLNEKDILNGLNFDSSAPMIAYKNHNILFEFISPYYDGATNIQYQFYLEGFDKQWSDWTNTNIKEYTNLFEGSYIFHVKAKNLYGIISNEIKFSFVIKPPIYRTWFAYLFYIILIISLVIMIYQFRAYNFAQEKHKLETILNERTRELADQKERAEELIKNILPEETARELRDKGKASKKKYKQVSVLFSDVQGFTHIAENMSPDMLIDELNVVFKAFDDICDIYGIEKIKTIGDAFMCAGGVPKANRTNPVDIILAALKMQDNIINHKEQFKYKWAIRIGIHTGPVVAGVVGSKKFTYDIWGDTVNIASRMESSSIAGEINVSGITYDLVKDYFICEYRGKLPVKYKGEIDMYFIKSIKPDFSVDGKGIEPNHKFWLKLQFLRFEDLEEFVLSKLEHALPNNLYYHNVKHTIDVMVQVEILGLGEGVSREEMLILKTTALFHDYGFVSGYDDHEELSAKHANEILPNFKYSREQIDTICKLILATKFPPNPTTKLEKIICDADLDYLGRSDFIPVSQNLFRELYERGKIRSIEEWNKMQYEFIRVHQYYTETAKKMRNVKKTNQMDELDRMI
jgi:class 3 adenylate cyclase